MAQLVMAPDVKSRLTAAQTRQLGIAAHVLDRLMPEVWDVKVFRLTTLLHYGLALVLQYRREAGLGADVYAYSMLLKEGGPDNLPLERDAQLRVITESKEGPSTESW